MLCRPGAAKQVAVLEDDDLGGAWLQEEVRGVIAAPA